MSSLTGPIAPAPGRFVVTFTRKSDGALVDVPNSQIRVRSPSGTLVSLALTRLSLGTYAAGSTASPTYLDGEGKWLAEGSSSVPGDLVYPDEITVTVKSDGFPSGSTTLQPAVAPTDGNSFARWTVTTTDATPTRLARIPLAADEAVEIAISVFGVSGANAFERVGLAFYKRTGSAAPVLDTDAIAAGLTGVFGSSWGNAALTAATAAFAINTDSIDINVTGIAATTIRWSLQTGAWFYV